MMHEDVRMGVRSKGTSKAVPDQAFGRDQRICNRNRPTPHLEITYLLNVRVLQALEIMCDRLVVACNINGVLLRSVRCMMMQYVVGKAT